MQFLRLACLLLPLAASAQGGIIVGNFATWAAFCDQPRHCLAISMPVERNGAPFLVVAIDAKGPLVRARIGRPVRDATLLIDGRRYPLASAGDEAVADGPTSRRIIAAMRTGETLTLISTARRGGTRRHHYLLAGAPSAIDAAIVAALR